MHARFWEIVCGMYPAVVLLFGMNATLLVLLVITFPFVDPNSASYYASLLAGAILVTSLAALAWIIRICRSR